MGWAFQFAPTGAFTLEANVLFESYALALAYAKTDATALVGKVISVVNDGVYTIEAVGENAVLKKVGADIDLSNYVTKDQISSIFTYKGSVDKYTDLPKEGVAKGDVWNIKEAFELEDELGNKQQFPAGTNVAYDGEGWDTLAGEIDLSAYAKTQDLEDAKTTLTTAIGGVAADLVLTNAEVAKKVEKVDGYSLISAEKLALIDTNANEIQALEDLDLDNRLKTIESAFTGEGGTIDLGDITNSISQQGSRISALETDNGTNKTNIATLQTQVNGHADRLTAIEALDVQQAEQISGLTTRVENVEKLNGALTDLTTLVGTHTESISTLTTGVADAKALATSEAASALASAKEYADGLAVNYDEAGAAADALAQAKEYANGLADNYDKAGDAEQALKDAKDYADSLNTAMDTRVKVLEAIDHAKLATDAAASAVATVLDDAPEAFDTLKEVAEWIANNDHASDVATLVTDVAALKAINHEAYIAADEVVLATAKSYTDDEIAKLSFDAAGTAKTLADQALVDAKAYADDKVGELGTAAYKNVEFFATAAQGALAETAAQQANTYTKAEVDSAIENAFAWIVVEDENKE